MDTKFLEDTSEFYRVDNKSIDLIIKIELEKNIYFGFCIIDGNFKRFINKDFKQEKKAYFLCKNEIYIFKNLNQKTSYLIEMYEEDNKNKDIILSYFNTLLISFKNEIELVTNIKALYEKQNAKNKKRLAYDLLYNNLITDNFLTFFVQESKENGLYILACNNSNNILKYLYKIKKGYNFKDVEYFIKKCRSLEESFIIKFLKEEDMTKYFKKNKLLIKKELLKEQKKMIENIYATNINYI